MITHKMKPAFSLITAIFVIVIMAGLLAMVSNLAGKITKETGAQYRKEQAMLLAKSYTEFAILAIQGHQMDNVSNDCLRRFTADINSLKIGGTNTNGVRDGEGYRVEVSMQYIGLRNQGINCPANAFNSTGHKSFGHHNINSNRTTSNDVSVTVDVYVMYHDMDVIAAIQNAGGTISNSTPWVTYHRRTIQKL